MGLPGANSDLIGSNMSAGHRMEKKHFCVMLIPLKMTGNGKLTGKYELNTSSNKYELILIIINKYHTKI